jgi:plastocyanin
MNDDDPMYRPSNIQITAGQTVEWENDGQVSHSVTDDPARANTPGDALLPAGTKPFNSGNVMPGGSFRHTFTLPGRYRYFCLTHEGDRMVGEITVQPPSAPGELVARSKAAPPRERLAQARTPTEQVTSSESSTAAPIQIVKMNDDDPMYQPTIIQITAGQTIKWENDGQVSHSVTDDPARANKPGDALVPAGAKPFNSGNVMPGGTYRHTFTLPGRYRYFCLTHEADKMIGEIMVVPPPPPQQEELVEVTRRSVHSESRPAVPPKIVKMYDDEPMYEPSSIRIVSGQAVEWKNEGEVRHSVSDDPAQASEPIDAMGPPGARPFNSGDISPGGRFRHTFTEPGRYRYFCRAHEANRMIGEVIVEPAKNSEASRSGTTEASQSAARADGLSLAARPSIRE